MLKIDHFLSSGPKWKRTQIILSYSFRKQLMGNTPSIFPLPSELWKPKLVLAIKSWPISSWKSLSITHSSMQDSTASTPPPFPGPPTLFCREDKVEKGIKNSNLSQSGILLCSISLMKVYIKNNYPFLGYEDTLLANTAYILFLLFEWNKQEKYTNSSKKDQCHKTHFEKTSVVTTTISHIYLLRLHTTHPLGNTSGYLLNHLMHWLQLCLLLHSSKLQKFHLFPYSCELEHLSKKMKKHILKNENIYYYNSKYWGKILYGIISSNQRWNSALTPK